MRIYAGYKDLGEFEGATAVGIGIFDGVHRGHQALLRRTVELGQGLAGGSVAYTFHPHPAAVLNPTLAPQLIEPVQQRLRRFEGLGLDAAVIEPFDRNFASMAAVSFVRDVLVGFLKARHIIVGAGFTFGSRQQGNVALLRQLGQELGFEVHPVAHVRVGGIEASSTKVREFVHTGQLSGATLLLGRPFCLVGQVIEGAHRGTGLGFPTANLRAANEITPARGVYAAIAQGPFGKQPAVTNIGYTPTFGSNVDLKIEAYLIDYRGPSFYGANITLELTDRLRDEQRFETVDALKAQIAADVAQARQLYLASPSGT
jgi:riboflavin kinase/FMN adenylyltransferase